MIIYCGVVVFWVSVGLGKHITEVEGSLRMFLTVNFAQQLIYKVDITLAKLSVLLFYGRIFGSSRRFRFALYLVAFPVVSWGVVLVFVDVANCKPIRKYWDLSVPGHCLDPYWIYVGEVVANIIIDIVILLLPLPRLWKLQVSVEKKIGLSIAFTLSYWWVMMYCAC